MVYSKLSLFLAGLSQLVIGAGVLWFFAILFGGPENAGFFRGAACWVMVGFGALTFFVNDLLLRKDRSLLLLIGIDLLAAAAELLCLFRFFPDESRLLLVMLTVISVIGEFFQLRWETGHFRDETMALQLQVLALLAICQIWLASQLEIPASWAGPMFLFGMLLLCALVISKISGIPAEKRRRGFAVSRTGIVAAIMGTGAVLAILAAALAEPAGRFFIALYDHVKGIFAAMLYAFGTALGFFFSENRVRLDEQGQSSDAAADAGGGSMSADAGGGDTDVFRILFHVVMIGLAIALLIGLLRILLGMVVGVKARGIQSRRGKAEDGEGFWKRMLAEIRHWMRRTRAMWILQKHPDSIGALIVFLEKKCRNSELLCRRQGETLHEFLLRLTLYVEERERTSEEKIGAERPETKNTEMKSPEPKSPETKSPETETSLAHGLRALIAAADRACYGRNGDLLQEFPESRKIRTFRV